MTKQTERAQLRETIAESLKIDFGKYCDGFRICPKPKRCSFCEIDFILKHPTIAAALAALEKQSLFQSGEFRLHSGSRSSWKVDCDALNDTDLETLASMVVERHVFSKVVGVPRGGLRLAKALEKYCMETGPTMVVDDVLTTGASMEAIKAQTPGDVVGVVIFARGVCPDWIRPLWQDGVTVSAALQALEREQSAKQYATKEDYEVFEVYDDYKAGRLVRLADDQSLPSNPYTDEFRNGRPYGQAKVFESGQDNVWDAGFRRVEPLEAKQ